MVTQNAPLSPRPLQADRRLFIELVFLDIQNNLLAKSRFRGIKSSFTLPLVATSLCPPPTSRRNRETTMPHRCEWAGSDPLSIAYHDEEWGVPAFNDRHLFKMLILEGAQAGLSWMTILRKRALSEIPARTEISGLTGSDLGMLQ